MKTLKNIDTINEMLKQIDVVTLKEKIKKEKTEKRNQLKNDKLEKTIIKKEIVFNWLDETKSKTALEKFVKNNPSMMLEYLNKVNLIHSTNIKINEFNKQLFKFGYLHELNTIDLTMQVIEEKQFFNMNYFLTLLDRFAKFKNVDTKEFKETSKRATQKYIENKYNTKVKKFVNLYGANIYTEIDKLIAKNKNVSMQKIIDTLAKNYAI